MGKFNGPHFRCDENIVSVWIASCPGTDIPDDYFEENYGGDDEDPFNQFSTDFGFGYYDHDFVENAALASLASVDKIIENASYGHSFAHEAMKSSPIKITEHIFLMYNFKYDPGVTGITESKYYRFIGAFNFKPNA